MIVYAAGRQQGKTTTVIRWFLEDPQRRGVICLNKSTRNHFLGKLYRMTGFMRVSFRRYEGNIIALDRDYGIAALNSRGIREVAIDDAERVIGQIIGLDVQLVAITGTLIDCMPRTSHELADQEYEDFNAYCENTPVRMADEKH